MNPIELPAAEVSKKHSLLLVDDEADILFALKRVFRRDGYTILTANSATEALKLLEQHKFDVIISDQKMPGMCGIEFLRAAKVSSPDSIRIMLSTNMDEQTINDAIKECVVCQSISKPWDNDCLRELIKKMVLPSPSTDACSSIDQQAVAGN
jgi:response regulator RpfG family c-di-GMP phosphodiesterase